MVTADYVFRCCNPYLSGCNYLWDDLIRTVLSGKRILIYLAFDQYTNYSKRLKPNQVMARYSTGYTQLAVLNRPQPFINTLQSTPVIAQPGYTATTDITLYTGFFFVKRYNRSHI